MKSRFVIGRIDFKQKITGPYLLIIVDRNVDNRAGYAGRNTNDICSDLAIASPGVRHILLVQKPSSPGRDGNNDQRHQIPVSRDFHGAKKRPIRLPKRTTSAAKKRGRCQTWRVKPKCSNRLFTVHAHKKPRTITAIDHGVLKS